MAFTVNSMILDSGDDIYYTEKFRLVIETHLTLLRRIGITEEAIPNDLVYQFEGNFMGYLNKIGIPLYLHWIYLRVNGMTNPNQFGAAMRDPQQRLVAVKLIKPDHSFLAQIRALYLTSKFN